MSIHLGFQGVNRVVETRQDSVEALHLALAAESKAKKLVAIGVLVLALLLVFLLALAESRPLDRSREKADESLLFNRHVTFKQNDPIPDDSICIEDRCCDFSSSECDSRLQESCCSSVISCLLCCNEGPENERNPDCFVDACGCSEEYRLNVCPAQAQNVSVCANTESCVGGCCPWGSNWIEGCSVGPPPEK